MRPGTERVAAMVEALDHPQKTYPVIQISGTNGKFSTLAIITAVLSEMGLATGTYTSPDLGNVRERIGFALEPIDEDTFASTLTYLEPFVQMVEQRSPENGELTYFELLTVVAYEAFFDRAVHAAVIEAGLGGEYDATNVADAQVGVLTNVTLDHIRQFGGDLNKAAWEKAGIAKPGTTLVTGVEDDDIFESCEARDGQGRGEGAARRSGHRAPRARIAVGGQLIRSVASTRRTRSCSFRCSAKHQAHERALAVAAVEAFAGEALHHETLEQRTRIVSEHRAAWRSSGVVRW